jgi:hypothetical protein
MNAGRTGSSETVYLDLTDLRLRKRDFRFGSIATEMGCPRDVRFLPDSDQTADIAGGPVRADFVAKVGCC